MFINFDQYAQDANKFMDLLAQDLGYKDQKRHAGYIMRAFFYTLRDRISINESMNLLAQLPMFLKAIYVEGWKYKEKPDKIKSLDEFIETVNANQKKFYSETEIFIYVDEKTIKIIIFALGRYVSKEELKNILSQLPKEIRALVAA